MSDDKTGREKRRAATRAKTDQKLDAIGDVLGTIGKRVSKKLDGGGSADGDEIFVFFLLFFLFMAAAYSFASAHNDHLSVGSKFLMFGIVAVVGVVVGFVLRLIGKWWWNR